MLSFDTLIRNEITDGATKDYSNDATSRETIDTSDDVDFADFIGAVATLELENAMPADGGLIPVIMHPLYGWPN